MKCSLCHRKYPEEELKYPLMRFYGNVVKVCEKCKEDAERISRNYLQIKGEEK